MTIFHTTAGHQTTIAGHFMRITSTTSPASPARPDDFPPPSLLALAAALSTHGGQPARLLSSLSRAALRWLCVAPHSQIRPIHHDAPTHTQPRPIPVLMPGIGAGAPCHTHDWGTTASVHHRMFSTSCQGVKRVCSLSPFLAFVLTVPETSTLACIGDPHLPVPASLPSASPSTLLLPALAATGHVDVRRNKEASANANRAPALQLLLPIPSSIMRSIGEVGISAKPERKWRSEMSTFALLHRRGVDVVAYVDGSRTSATPTPRAPTLCFFSISVWPILSLNIDGISIVERAPIAISSGLFLHCLTIFFCPASSSFLFPSPAFIPSSSLWDDALARAVIQSASISGGAGSLHH